MLVVGAHAAKSKTNVPPPASGIATAGAMARPPRLIATLVRGFLAVRMGVTPRTTRVCCAAL